MIERSVGELEQSEDLYKVGQQPAKKPAISKPLAIQMQDESAYLNEDKCFRCKSEGKLFCCDNCFRTYHARCLDEQPSDSDEPWICPCCMKRDKCTVCEEEVDKVRDNDHLICTLCFRRTHFPCAGIPAELFAEPLIICRRNPTRKQQRKYLEKIAAKHQRYFMRDNFFVCEECLCNSEVKYIIGKRAPGGTPYIEVIPYHCSNIHITYITPNVSNYSLVNHRNSIKKRKPVSTRSSQPKERKEMLDFMKPEIQKILVCKKPIFNSVVKGEAEPESKDIYEEIEMLKTREVEYGDPNNYIFLVRWSDMDTLTWEDEYVVKVGDQSAFNRFIARKEYEIGYLLQKDYPIERFRNKDNEQAIIQKLSEEESHKATQLSLYQQLKAIYTKKRNVFLYKHRGIQTNKSVVSAFISHVHHAELSTQPFLVISRSKDIPSWEMHLKFYCQDLEIIKFVGNKDIRNEMRIRELFHQAVPGVPKFDVLLTTVAVFMDEKNTTFYNSETKVFWESVIVDDDSRPELMAKEFFEDVLSAHKILIFKDNNPDSQKVFYEIGHLKKMPREFTDAKTIAEYCNQSTPNTLLEMIKPDPPSICNSDPPNPPTLPEETQIQNKGRHEEKLSGQKCANLNQDRPLHLTENQGSIPSVAENKDQQAVIENQKSQKSNHDNSAEKKKTQSIAVKPNNAVTHQIKNMEDIPHFRSSKSGEPKIITDLAVPENMDIEPQPINVFQSTNPIKSSIPAWENIRPIESSAVREYQFFVNLSMKLQKNLERAYSEAHISGFKWDELKRRVFFRFTLVFGLDFPTLTDIWHKLVEFAPDIFNGPEDQELNKYVKCFLYGIMNPVPPTDIQHFYFQVKPTQVAHRLANISLLQWAYNRYRRTPQSFPVKQKMELFSGHQPVPITAWNQSDDLVLINQVTKAGYGNWKEICESTDWKASTLEDRINYNSMGLEYLYKKLLFLKEGFTQLFQRERYSRVQKILMSRLRVLLYHLRIVYDKERRQKDRLMM